MIWLVLYIVLLLGIGVHHWFQHRKTTLNSFVVYDRRASGFSGPDSHRPPGSTSL